MAETIISALVLVVVAAALIYVRHRMRLRSWNARHSPEKTLDEAEALIRERQP